MYAIRSYYVIRLQEQCADEREARALRLTLKNLILPEQGMGETFKVLVQGKGIGSPELLCARRLTSVITSYSIHYTKLYERKQDILIAKNYLNEDEIDTLNRP